MDHLTVVFIPVELTCRVPKPYDDRHLVLLGRLDNPVVSL